MQDEVIYRCVHAACARTLPRRVNFCPYCGTAQQIGVSSAAHVNTSAAAVTAPRTADTLADAAHAPWGAGETAAVKAWADASSPIQDKAAEGSPPQVVAATARPAAASGAGPARAAAGSAAGGAGVRATVTPAQPRAPTPAPAPQREPIRLRWWLLALAALWLIWVVAKPSAHRIEARIDKAIALANECKSREAQSELIALRATRAKPGQLQRLQQALNEAAATCSRARQRERAWRETSAAVESLLGASSIDRARTRLSMFTRRWGEDGNTRALKARLDAASRARHPLADDTERGQ